MFQRIVALAAVLVSVGSITGCAAGSIGEAYGSSTSANSKGEPNEKGEKGEKGGKGDTDKEEAAPGDEESRPKGGDKCGCPADEIEGKPDAEETDRPGIPKPPKPPVDVWSDGVRECIEACEAKLAHQCGADVTYCGAICKGGPSDVPPPDCDKREWDRCAVADGKAPSKW